MTVLVTGGAGFIGSNFILDWLADSREAVLCLDKLTYAGNLGNLSSVIEDPRMIFIEGDIGDARLVADMLRRHRPRAIVNFAAESHVDRSIEDPDNFVQTNVVGTYRLLETARTYWNDVLEGRDDFRFVHISTDEVYGSLEPGAPPFRETNAYRPNSPYSASKAAADHMVRAYHHTYGLPVVTTNCSNNYGPFQHPEKLIPLCIRNALAGEKLPIYGDGLQRRDWLYVGDHCGALRRVLEGGSPGEVYNIGGRAEMANIDLVRKLCGLLDELAPRPGGGRYEEQIAFVKDRPGHDRRYAIDCSKTEEKLGWTAAETIDSGLRRTVRWYLDNQDWMSRVSGATFGEWMERQYGSLQR